MDIYSYGIVLFQLISNGYAPFEELTPYERDKAVINVSIFILIIYVSVYLCPHNYYRDRLSKVLVSMVAHPGLTCMTSSIIVSSTVLMIDPV